MCHAIAPRTALADRARIQQAELDSAPDARRSIIWHSYGCCSCCDKQPQCQRVSRHEKARYKYTLSGFGHTARLTGAVVSRLQHAAAAAAAQYAATLCKRAKDSPPSPLALPLVMTSAALRCPLATKHARTAGRDSICQGSCPQALGHSHLLAA